jgi:hypothetical protein
MRKVSSLLFTASSHSMIEALLQETAMEGKEKRSLGRVKRPLQEETDAATPHTVQAECTDQIPLANANAKDSPPQMQRARKRKLDDC